jgi:hypothetical protein
MPFSDMSEVCPSKALCSPFQDVEHSATIPRLFPIVIGNKLGFQPIRRDHIHVPFSTTFVIHGLEQIGEGSMRGDCLRAGRA